MIDFRSPRSIAIMAAIFIFVPVLLNAAPPRIEWSNSYGGSAIEHGFDAVAIDAGGFLLAGQTESAGAGGQDVYVVAVDGTGKILWERTHGGAAHDVCQAVIRTDDGGFALAGYSGLPPNDYNVLLMKLDSQGNFLWQQSFGGTGDQRGRDLVQMDDGGFLIVGERSFYLVRTDSEGNLEWERNSGTVNDIASSLTPTPHGEFLLAGHRTDGRLSPEFDARLLKLSRYGSIVWDRTFDESLNDQAHAAIEADNGDIVFCGISGGTTALWRTDEGGNRIWLRTYGGKHTAGLFQLTDGGFIIAGTSYDNQVGGYQVYLVGTDANGDLAWESQEGGPYWELSRSMIRAEDGGFLVVGSANQPNGIGYDLYALRLTGAASDVTAVSPPGANVGLQLSNHPNPFNPGTTISFNMPEPGPVHLRIYDFRGRLMRSLLNGELLGAGSQEKFWNGLDDAGRPLAAGIYLSKIVSSESVETRRMTLLK